MNTRRALAIAAVLALPATATAAPAEDAGGGSWSVGIGLAVPTFSSESADDLPTFVVLSSPFRTGSLRVEPELGAGSGRSYVTQVFSSSQVVGAPTFRADVPVTQRFYRLGLTVAPEWSTSDASLFAGPQLAMQLRRWSYDFPDEEWSDAFDLQVGATVGGELALSPAVALGAALRFGWTLQDALDEAGTNLSSASPDSIIEGQALLSVRIAL